MANQLKPTIRTIRREAVVIRFVETISEVYAEPAASSSAFPARPGLAKVATVTQLRRAVSR